MSDWHVFRGVTTPHDWTMPESPPWRSFDGGPVLPIAPEALAESTRTGFLERAITYCSSPEEVELVNVAIYLRRPLLITGKPGTGKSTLAYAVARELRLGPVLRWPITSRSTLQEGLYRYDAIGRLQDSNLSRQDGGEPPDIGQYVQLGPLGTSLLPYERPRVLLIDEIDKSDIDLPNDLLNVFEEGEYRIPELARIAETQPRVQVDIGGSSESVVVREGHVRCRSFPIVILTSNGEREFPPPFLRRCIRLEMSVPDEDRLARIVRAHLGPEIATQSEGLIEHFAALRTRGDLATDQLLNAVFLTFHAARNDRTSRIDLANRVLHHLSRMG